MGSEDGTYVKEMADGSSVGSADGSYVKEIKLGSIVGREEEEGWEVGQRLNQDQAEQVPTEGPPDLPARHLPVSPHLQ